MALFPNIEFKSVDWKATLLLHLVRSGSAGVLWATVALLAGAAGSGVWWAMPVLMPVMYFIGMPMYLFIAKIVASMLGGDGFGPAIVGLMALAFALGIVVGDPIVYVLHKKWPELVPVEHFAFFNLVVVLFVYPPALIPEG